MAKYIKLEDAKQLLLGVYDCINLPDEIKEETAEWGLQAVPSIDLDNYIPIKYVQDFCKDCADEGIGTVSTYMEDAGEAIVKSWLAVKDTDFGVRYKKRKEQEHE